VKKHLSRVGIVATLAFGLFAVLICGGQAFAVSPSSTVNNANTLKLSPVRSDITVPAGTSATLGVKVTNLTNAPMTIQPIENDFIAGDERGTPALILDADKYAPTHSLKRYMVPLKNVTIPANTVQEIKVTITVPTNAKPGGYFGAIRFAPVASDGAQSVNLNASAASIILMTVPGDMTEQLSLTNFDIMQGSKVDTLFQSANDLHLEIRMTSSSSVQEGPFGQVSVTQGKKVVYSYDFNTQDPRDMILPDSARRWDIPLKNIGSFGNYTVHATLTYGTKNETIDVSKSFWVIPWTVVIVAVGGALLLIALIVGIVLGLRSYKHRLLNRHGHNGRRR